MEFTVSSTELLKGLNDVSKAIPAKTALPILENFLFNVREDGIEVTASDQEVTLRTVIGLQNVSETGMIAVPARQLVELLKTLPDQPLTIRTKGESSFECVWSNGNSSLPYFPAADYPEIKRAGDDAMTVVFPSGELLDGISGTIYATADDEMRPTMNGIFFDLDEGASTLVASDSHKLICYTLKGVDVPEKSSFILHKKPAAVLKGLIGKDDQEVTARFDSSMVEFSFGDTVLVSRLVVGKYPRYRDVIPQNNSNVLRIDRNLLLGTLRRVSVCANKASNHIKLNLAPGQLEITAQDLGFALAAYEKLECDYNGDVLSIGFKSSFLVEIFSNMACETLVMKFCDAKRAALVVPSDDEEESGRMCGIVMPIMVA